MLIKLAALGTLGYLGYRYFQDHHGHAAFADGQPSGGHSDVRDAGPEAMRDRPDSWDRTDEAGDESFPASDPPANY